MAVSFLLNLPLQNPNEMNLRDTAGVIPDKVPHIAGTLRQQTRAGNLICSARTFAQVQMCPLPFITLQLLHQGSCGIILSLPSVSVQSSPPPA